MDKFLLLFKDPKYLIGSLFISIFVLLVLVCWIVGLGIKEILLISVIIFIASNVYVLIKRNKNVKQSKQLEDSLAQQAEDQVYSTRPDRRDDVDKLKTKFDSAITSLKNSKLGKGQRGSAALYALPWYIIIGPPGSGKSTALRYSELEFPYVDPESKDPKVKGLGGTKNCDFWFTTDGILLDTAGRYVMPMAQADDREEWQEFLKYLKKYRRKMPINGVVCAVSIAEEDENFFGILTAEQGIIEQHAKNIRSRIDELIKTLEIEFPVYLVFTKCDRLSGFVEFYDDFGKDGRSQVWGHTLRKSLWQSRHPQDIFMHEFQRLCKHLNQRRLLKLKSERKSERKRKIYIFPLEFVSAKKKLAKFVKTLFEHNRYLENPVFRGFYFTSGTQVGNPIDRVINRIKREFGFETKTFDESPKKTRSYFIKDLFNKIIFPDQVLVSPSTKGGHRIELIRWVISAMTVVAMVIILLSMSFSYRRNHHLLGKTAMAADSIAQVEPPLSLNDLRYLEYLRLHVADLDAGPSKGNAGECIVEIRLKMRPKNGILSNGNK